MAPTSSSDQNKVVFYQIQEKSASTTILDPLMEEDGGAADKD